MYIGDGSLSLIDFIDWLDCWYKRKTYFFVFPPCLFLGFFVVFLVLLYTYRILCCTLSLVCVYNISLLLIKKNFK